MKAGTAILALSGWAALAGCQATVKHEVEPIRVEPIHITVDVNVRVDRQLDNFFDFQDKKPADNAAPAPTPAPKTNPNE
jgi:hypothetical protein